MTKTEALEQSKIICRIRRLSLHTERSYCGWLARFFDHCKANNGASREDKVRLFLEHLAPITAASSQNQALNAIVFFYRDVVKEPLGDLGQWARAQRPKRLPSWLPHDEMMQFIGSIQGVPLLMAEVCYGGGLRASELLHLRVKDVDTKNGTVTVRCGKGDKDRVTCLPKICRYSLKAHMKAIKAIWQTDQEEGAAPIYLPDGLERKFPNAGREWPWFWLWPAPRMSIDPRTGTSRRHHLHSDTFRSALDLAQEKAKLNKRITPAVLRNSAIVNALQNEGLSLRALSRFGIKSANPWLEMVDVIQP